MPNEPADAITELISKFVDELRVAMEGQRGSWRARPNHSLAFASAHQDPARLPRAPFKTRRLALI